MAGNSIGQLFRVTTCGESHGVGLMAIVDGVPPGLALTEEDLQKISIAVSREPRNLRLSVKSLIRLKSFLVCLRVKLLVRQLVYSFAIQTKNRKIMEILHKLFRPGHADYTYTQKYGFRDYRGGGRSSARETAMRVAAGAIAKKYLAEKFGVLIRGHVTQIGNEVAEKLDWNEVPNNPFFCGDVDAVPRFEALVTSLREQGTSCGAKLEILAEKVPVGWGEPVFDRLDADIAHAMMSINAVKGVEIGDGFAVAGQFGHETRDELTSHGFLANHAGGILGGISSGQTIRVAIALKPTASITTPGKTINLNREDTDVLTKGRHDPCVGVRATPIAEAMLAIVLMDHFLRHRAQNADVVPPFAPIEP